MMVIEQIETKSSAKSFVRAYNFLASILPIGQPDWEKMSIFLTLLVPKLPTPAVDDLTQGILDSVDLDSYRAEKNKEISISLDEEESTLKPSTFGVGSLQETELDTLDHIVKEFNDMFGNISWEDEENVKRQIKNLPEMVMKNDKLQKALKNSSEQNARIEYDIALQNTFVSIMKDSMELFKQVNSDDLFRKWVSDRVWNVVYSEYINSNKSANSSIVLDADKNIEYK